MLWLDSHRPEKKVIPPEVRARLDRGNEFGDSAMGMFGPFEEMTAYKEDGRLDYVKMIENTAEHLKLGTPVICEAAFSWKGNYCAVDILRKAAEGYELYEVKNSDHLGEQFVKDVGFQWFILSKLGIAVTKRCVVLPGSEAGTYDVRDVSEESVRYFKETSDNFWDLYNIKKSDDEVFRKMGEQCYKPYKCWYCEYCEQEENKNNSN